MKILIISAESDRPEASLYVELARRGIEVVIISAPTCPFQEFFKENGLRVITHSGGGRVSPKTILFLRMVIKTEAPDVCHFTNTRLLSNGLIASLGLKAAITAYRGTSGHLNRLDPLSWLTYLNPRISKVWCVSNAVRDYMISVGVPRERTSVIYKGHNAEWYRCDSPPSLRQFGIPEGSFVVASVANVRPVKGIDVLITAFKSLKEDQSIHLLLMGKTNGIEEVLSRLDPSIRACVHLTGFVAKPYELLYGCHVFVMPSIAREGLPKALLEAMAVGIAPIVTNVGGMPEVVRDGVEGLVVPPSNPSSIAEAIIRIKRDENLRSKFSLASKRRISEAFSLNDTVIKVVEMFGEVTAN